MTRAEQIKFCKICTHRLPDIKQGILCDLTKAKADFEYSCANFEADQKVIEVNMLNGQSYSDISSEDEEPNMKIANWFAWIGVLSLINIVLQFFGGRMIFGLGITSIFSNVLGYIGMALSLLISIIYIFIYVLTSFKEKEWAYRLGFYSYLADTILLITLLFSSIGLIVDAIFHFFLLIVLYIRHPFFSQQIKNISKQEKWDIERIVMSIIMWLITIITLLGTVLIIIGLNVD